MLSDHIINIHSIFLHPCDLSDGEVVEAILTVRTCLFMFTLLFWICGTPTNLFRRLF